MKFKIGLLIAMMMVIGMSYAQPILPMPVPVKVVTFADPNGILVTAINERTGETVTAYTDSNGEAIIEWANTAQKYQSGDVIRVTVYNQIKYGTAPNIDIMTFDFTANCPAPKPCPTCETCQPPQEQQKCYISEIELEPGQVLSRHDTYCDVEVRALEQTNEPITGEAAIAVIIAMVGAAYAAVRITKSGVKHLHPGIVGYHSIYTSHTNEKIRHAKGCFDPEYKKDSSGKYYFAGCKSGEHK